MVIREAVYDLVSTWNEQCSVLGATVRALKRGLDSLPSSAQLSSQANQDTSASPMPVEEVSVSYFFLTSLAEGLLRLPKLRLTDWRIPSRRVFTCR